jgi:hypothetical protein
MRGLGGGLPRHKIGGNDNEVRPLRLLRQEGRSAPVDYADLKVLISEVTGISKDALHVHVALLLYLASMLLLRLPLRSIWPLAIVLLFEVGNEAYDLWHQQAHNEPPRFSDSLGDLWNTLLWPAALYLLARRGLIRAGSRDQAAVASPAPEPAGGAST